MILTIDCINRIASVSISRMGRVTGTATGGVLLKKVSLKFSKFNRKTHVLESLFNDSTELKA